MRPCLWVIALAALASACETNPSAPGSANPSSTAITGTWSGTMTSSNMGTQDIVLQLMQIGHAVTGSYRLSPRTDFTGVISSGTVDSLGFAGLLFLNAGAGCQGHGNFTGTVTRQELRWTSTGFTSPVPCFTGVSSKDLPRNVTIQVRR